MITRGEGKALEVQIEQKMRLSTLGCLSFLGNQSNVDSLISGLQKASKGLSDCVFRLNHTQHGDYEGECLMEPAVYGWRSPTEEDLVLLAEQEEAKRSADESWLQRQVKNLETAGFVVTKGKTTEQA